MTRVAFYAPLKPPDHPTPSGDRRMARLLMAALGRAGFAPALVSRLRSREGTGDPAAQAAIRAAAAAEAARLTEALRADPPALWFTYHGYWKAPDLIGPAVAGALGLPYAVAEGVRAPKRRIGPWAGFAASAEAALDRADALFWMTGRDRPMLEAHLRPGQRLLRLAPFIEAPPAAPPIASEGPLRLLAVAMMRAPDKTASYTALAAALTHLEGVDWRLEIVGDGPDRAAVERAFAPLAGRVAWRGRIDDPAALAAAYAAADLLVWPGVNEAYGLAYLEAQGAGRAVVAEDRPGVRDVAAPSAALTPPGDAAAFAAALRAFAGDRARLAEAGAAARAHVLAHHGLDAAAETLRAGLAPLAEGRR
jgi:glycosyltransferase involved in cell wall biosynthesis